MFKTLLDALDARATSDRALTHVRAADDAHRVPFARLRARAEIVLGHLQRCGVRAGQPVVLRLDRTDAFVDAFWACVLGGIVPVPLAPGGTDDHRRKLFGVLEALEGPAVLSTRKLYGRLRTFAEAEGLAGVMDGMQGRLLRVDDVPADGAPGVVHRSAPDDLAFVQFSSGSTQAPKGVQLTHANVLANVEAILTAARATEDDVGLSWMPLTHDMGLVGFHLTPLVGNIAHVLLPTELFVRRPRLWLERIQADGATITGAPNFGYAHLLRTFDPARAEGLDLSRLRLIFNGAEPISPQIVQRFLHTLAPFGLRSSAMFPVYGLAEATVAVTAPEAGAGLTVVHVDRAELRVGAAVAPVGSSHPRALAMVGHGQPVDGCALRLVDDADAEVPDGALGHIQVRGANVTGGFMGAPERYAAARTADGWIRTGDLGFRHAAGLVVAGRAKDVIFVRGLNVYPQDVEWTAGTLEGLEPGKVAAAGAPDPEGGDRMLVFVVHKGDPAGLAPLARAIRRAVSERMGVDVHAVLPVPRLPKTTSGKVQRGALVASFEAGELVDALAAAEAAAPAGGDATDPLVAQLQEIVGRVMPETPIGVDDNIFELGTSSLTLAQIYEEIDRVWPNLFEATDFFDYPTIREVAAYLRAQGGDVQS